MSAGGKQLNNPFSTGGGGSHFEALVQASFVLLMITGGYIPCLPCGKISKIKLQSRFAGYQTDDIVIFNEDPSSKEKRKLLVQIKHSISFTEKDSIFSEVIDAAWKDFTNPDIFTKEKDAFALITGSLTATDTNDVRTILEWSREVENATEFSRNVQLSNFSSEAKRRKLQVFKYKLKHANECNDVSENDLFEFLKHFHLIGYDLDAKSGITLALLHSLISQYSINDAHSIWTQLVDEVQFANQNAGTITMDSLSDDLKKAFIRKNIETIPSVLVKPVIPTTFRNWNNDTNVLSLAIINLLGSWNEQNENDCKIAEILVKSIADITFKKWLSEIQAVLQQPDTPVALRNGHWSIINRITLWNQFATRIFDKHIDIFKKLTVRILTEVDPQFELASENRFAAGIYGKVLKYSAGLRKGIVETLALLGTHGTELIHCSKHKAESTTILAIRDIFENSSWQLWGSLNNLLPILAEASPAEFLNSVDHALRQTPCPFDELFKQESNGITGWNYLTGLLWALESLAWSDEYIVHVSIILGELASHDPGGNWTNRPINSLTTILLPWMPQTVAPLEKRISAIKAIQKDYPDVAWKLVLSLLPNQVQTSSGSHKPSWRNFIPDGWEAKNTGDEYWRQVKQYAEIAVDISRQDINKLKQLVGALDNLPSTAFDSLIKYLSSDEIKTLPEKVRQPVWENLKAFINRHRRHSDAKWALPTDIVDRIEAIAEQLTPTRPQYLNRRLFSNNDFDLYEKNGDWSKQQQEFDYRRQMAIQAILDAEGVDAVIQFIEDVESPYLVGWSLGCIADIKLDNRLLPQFLNTQNIKQQQFMNRFILGRFTNHGWTWVDNVNRENWSLNQASQFLAYLPFEQDTWKRVTNWLCKSENKYWKTVNVNPYPSQSDLTHAIDKLNEVGRSKSAIDCLYCQFHNKKPFDRERTTSTLLQAISSSESVTSTLTHEITELIKMLQNDPDINPDDCAKIEWAYLPLLNHYHNAEPKLLIKLLSTNPEFFCEIIRLRYRSKKKEKSIEEPNKQKNGMITYALNLLQNWKKPPGLQDDGSFLGIDFKNWFESVKTICTESGHFEVAMNHIGKLLYYCPPDSQGLWIDKLAADELNKKDAEDMRRGFFTEVFNSRGAYWVDPTGKPEFELSEMWKKKAEDVEKEGFARFSVTLREIAKSFERQAQHHIDMHKAEFPDNQEQSDGNNNDEKEK